MGDGSPPTTPTRRGSSLWIATGTLAAVIAAGMTMQYWQAKPSAAATEPAAKPAKRVEALARVGKDVISFDMVAEEAVSRHGKEVLDDLVNRMIIQQACEAQGVSVSEAEVDQEVARIAKKFSLDTTAWYQMLQSERNIGPQQYRRSVIWPMLALKKLASEKVELNEAELVEAFERNYGPRVKVRMVMVDKESRAREVHEKALANPEAFEELAQEFSIDPSSRTLGGVVPPIPKHSGSPDLEKAAFKLKPDQISGIVQVSPGRYVVMKCEGRTEQVVADLDEVRDSLVDELIEAKTQQTVTKVFDDLKKNARVDNYLTATSSGPDRFAPGAVTPAAGAAAGSAKVKQAAGSASMKK